MWPFEERPGQQDPVEKYRRWLRRWLLQWVVTMEGRWVHTGICRLRAAFGIF